MKTTLELPDPLMRALKVRAAKTDRKLKDVVAELIERGLSSKAAAGAPTRRVGAGAPNWNDVLAAIADGRYAHFKSQDEVNAWMDELRADRDDVVR